MHTFATSRLSPQQTRASRLPRSAARADCLLRIEGEGSAVRIEQALRAVVARHEILGTSGLRLQRVDLSGLPVGAREAELDRLSYEHGGTVSAVLAELSGQSRALYLSVSSLCADASSLVILAEELALACAGLLEEVETQYGDVADILWDLLESDEMEEGREFWLQFDLSRPVEARPGYARPRPAPGPFAPRRVSVDLRRERALDPAGLPSFAAACWAALLWRLGSQDRLTLGWSFEGRPHAALERIVGPLARYLPVIVDLAPGLRLRDLAARLRTLGSELAAYQDHFFWPSDGPREDWFPVVFDFREADLDLPAGPFRVTLQRLDACVDRFGLRLACVLGRSGLTAEIHYDSSRFDEREIRILADQLATLFTEACARPDAPLQELSLLGARQREELVVRLNETGRAVSGKTIHGLFEAQALAAPDRVALSFGGRQVTYGGLERAANRVAHQLVALGASPESRVAVCMRRSDEMVAALLGILKAGAAYVPLDPDHAPERLRLMLEDCGCRWLLARGSGFDPAPLTPPGVEVVDLDGIDLAGLPEASPAVPLDPANLAYVIYTSGSTGRPKGVEICHGAVVNFLESMRRCPGLDSEDGLAAVTTISFDIAGLELFLPLAVGARIDLLAREEAADGIQLAGYLDRSGATVMQATPSTWKMLLGAGWLRPAGLRVLCGGEGLPSSLAAQLTADGGSVWNLYGPTETTIWSTLHEVRPGDPPWPTAPIGRPIGNTRVYVVDPRMEPVSYGVVGEVYLGGAGLARGYHGQPGLTAERFIPDPFGSEPGSRLYRVGDLARFLLGGVLEFLGRADHQVKVRGHRIELGEIEAALCRHPGVREAVVAARTDATGSQGLVGYFVPATEPAPFAEDLLAFLRRLLPEPMVPPRIVALDRLPLTPNGKVDRKALPDPPAAAASGFATPRDETEAQLAAVWAEVLGLPEVGVDDNFFASGGHSLSGTILIHRMQQAFGVELTLAAVFDHPTVAGLARTVRQAAEAVPESPIVHLPRTASPQRFPLSFAQQRLWFVDQYMPGSAAYNVAGAARFRGLLRPDALEAALQEIVRRHEVLRTTYEVEGEGAVQVVHPAASVELGRVDLSGEDDPEHAALALAATEARRPFDLRRGPVLRTGLLRLGETDHVFLLNVHHIASDAWSNDILLEEASVLYRAACEGRDLGSALPPLAIQYADFALWQRDQLGGSRLARKVSYWKETLAEAPELLLPLDRPRPREQTSAGARREIRLARDLSERLAELGRAHGVTPFITLLASLCALLHRYSGQQDVVLGAPFAGRTAPEVERLIGFFINTLPLRVHFDAERPFGELLAAARDAVVGAQSHQELPFERLIDELSVERDPGRSPLYQAVFNYQSAVPAPPPLGDGLSFEIVEPDPGAAKFELTLALRETPAGLEGFLEYNTALFDRGTVERLLGHLANLLAVVAGRSVSGLAVADLPLFSASEWAELTGGRHARPAADVPVFETGCLHRLFERQVEAWPDRIALSFEASAWSYGELNRAANRVAWFLARRGVGPEVRVGLCFERGADLVVALLGVLKAGGTYVPLDPTYPEERLGFIARDSGLDLVLVQPRFEDRLPEGLGLPWNLDRFAGEPDGNPDVAVGADNGAYVIYTSGSTGRPKGVVISHGNVARLFGATSNWFGFDESDVWTLFHSYAFDFSVWEIWGALLHGGRLAVVPYWTSRSPKDFHALLAREGVTVLNQTPSAFAQLVRFEQAEAPAHGSLSLRHVIFGGEALDIGTLRPWIDRHGADCPRLVNMYGITETTVHVTYRPLELADLAAKRPGSPIGVGIPDLSIYLLDGGMRPVPIGAPGELYVGGPGLARGYLNRPELTAERFVPDPFAQLPGARLYRTGDGARLLPDGQIVFLGRLDNQIQIRGFRVELGEVQAALAAHPDVYRSAVLARTDQDGDLLLAAYVVPCPGSSPSVAELRAFLATRLPEYMIPRRFALLDALPTTSHGKLDVRALPPLEKAAAEAEAFLAPEGMTEEVLAAIWAEVLGLDRVGAEDNFFALGGDSILGIRVLGLARERGLDLTLQQLFLHQAVRPLAREIGADGEAAADPSLRPFGLVSEEVRAKLPADVVDAYPMSKMQLGMIYEMQLSPETLPYHNVDSICIRHRIDPLAFEEAVRRTVARNPVLRTGFHLSAYGEPLQLVHESASLPVAWYDLRGVAPDEQDEMARRYVADERRRPFDPARPTLLRFAVHRLTDDTFRFTVTEFHPILDGWSLTLLMRDLFTLHERILAGWEEPAEVQGGATFRDFIALEQAAIRSPECRGFWREALRDVSPVRFQPWPGLASTAGGGIHQAWLAIPPERVDELKRLARRAQVPIKSVLLAAHFKVLSLLSGQSDIVTGMQVNGRPEREGGDEAYGLFLNSMPLRLRLQPGTWLDLIRRTFDAEWRTLPFRRYPLANVQEDLGLGNEPLFEIFFNYVHFHAAEDLLRSEGMEMAGRSIREEPSHFGLLVNFHQTPVTSEMALLLQSPAGGLGRLQLERMRDTFEQVLASLLEGESPGLLEHPAVEALSPGERHQVLAEWNDTAWELPGDLLAHRLFEAQAESTPDAVAVVCDGDAATYADLAGAASRLARRLAALGVGPEVVIAFVAERGIEFLTAVLGIWKAGGAYLPLDPKHPAERLKSIVVQSGAPLILAGASVAGPVREIFAAPLRQRTLRLVVLEELLAAEPVALPAAPLPLDTPDCLAYVIYTSGSTGIPKGAMVTHRGMLNHLLAKVHLLDLGPGDIVAQNASQTFDISVWQLVAALLVGGRVQVYRDDVAHDPVRLLEQVAGHGVTVFETVPSLLQLMLSKTADGPDLGRLRWLIPTGEALPPELCRRWFEAYPGVPLVNAYGPTECSDDVTHRPIWKALPESTAHTPIGRPIENTRLYVLGCDLRPVPVSVPGELCVGGVGVGRGYLLDPARTAEVFVPDPFGEPGSRLYRTLDLVRHLPDGDLEFLGRIDHQVKIRGSRIELGEIEAVLQRYPGVGAAVAMVREASPGDRRLVAYLAADPRTAGEREGLRAWLAERLPEAMIPTSFVFLETMPLTPNGKLDRKALPAPDFSSVEAGSSRGAPRGPVEEMLARIWEDLLGLRAVGAGDDFFALGGHSLLAVQLVSRIREQLGAEVPLRSLFESRTVAGMAALVERERGRNRLTQPPLLPRPPGSARVLSFAEERLWFLDRLEGGSSYNVPQAVRLRGDLSVPVLAAVLAEICRRHEVLRTRYDEAEGLPVARVEPASGLPVPVVDLSGLPEAGRETLARDLAGAEAARPFDLRRGPLLRVSLLRLGGGEEPEHVALATFHHIVSDVWSTEVFLRELAALYGALSAGLPSSLPDLPVQYSDFAAWQRSWLSGEVLAGEIAAWRERLEGAPQALDLPTDRPRPAVPSQRGGRRAAPLPDRVARELRTLIRREGATTFMAMLASLAALLSRYTGKLDLLVGTPVANRGRLETEGLIGFFLNTLVLRMDLSGSPGLGELLRRARETALDAFMHQELPFERLVEELAVERHLSRSPLFQAMLVVQPAAGTVEMPGLAMTPFASAIETSKFDLTLFVLEQEDGGLSAILEYSRDLFEAATAERLLGHLGALLEGLVAAPDQPMERLSLLSGPERHGLLLEWNDTAAAEDVLDLIGPIEAQAALAPETAAVVRDGEPVSYGELNARANRLAHRLRGLGVGPGTAVALLLERSVDMIAAVLAVLKAGAAYVPLDPAYPTERLSFMLDDSGARVLLSQEALLSLLPAPTIRVLCLDRDAASLAGESDGNPPREPLPDDLDYIIYTSGSTGRPKGVAMTRRALANLIDWQESDPALHRPAPTLQFSSLSFDASYQEIVSTLRRGGTLHLITEETRRDPRALLEEQRRGAVERLYLPFVALRQLAERAQEEGGASGLCLREVVTAGEQLQIVPSVARLFASLPQCRLYNYYGPSETHVVTALALAGEPGGWPALPPIGRPIANTSIYLVDRQFEPVPMGIPGELLIGGASLARGYVGRPDVTAERFIPDPWSAEPGARLYRTGDLSRYRADGEIEFLGRLDHQVKIRGYRIEPGEIEAVLADHPEVRSAVVAVRNEPGRAETRLAAYVSLRGNGGPGSAELRTFLRERLPDYMVPATLVTLETLPLTPSGKVDRQALSKLDAGLVEEAPAWGGPPATPTEEMVAGIWGEVLGLARIGPEDSFFDLGGHSLLATRVLSRLGSAFRVNLPVRILFESPTVRALARRIETARSQGAADAPPPIRRADLRGDLPLSFAQERLWFIDRLTPGNSAYNLPFAVRLSGRLSVPALAASLEEIVRRHEALRTVFTGEAETPCQRVLPELRPAVSAVDLSGLPEPAEEEQVGQWMVQEALRPFDLERGPLVRLALVRLRPDEHLALLNLHHIVSDAWSMAVLVRELRALYQAAVEGRPSPLPELPVQYSDFALWQRSWLAGETLARQVAFWRAALEDAPRVLELPSDRPRPARRGARGGAVPFELSPELSADLAALGRREGATLFMTLLAAFNALLSRASGQPDLLVGTPIANRNQLETEGLIGFFVNTLVLRGDLRGEALSFRDLLSRVRETTLDAYSHQDLPFERLVEELSPERDLARTPLFQVMFSLENAPAESLELPGLRWSPVPLDAGVSKFDLTLHMGESGHGLRGGIEYSLDLFDPTTVRRIAGHFETLLAGVARAPGARLEQLPLISAPERQQALLEWNDAARRAPASWTIVQRFEEWAERTPDAPALAFEGALLSYRELADRTARLAARLRRMGVGLETPVAICLERSLEMIEAVLGVLRAGGAYVPIDPDAPAERIAHIVRDSGARAALTHENLRVLLPRDLEALAMDRESSFLPAEEGMSLPSGALAYLIYTSGSTGRPKGVAVEHRQLASYLEGVLERMDLPPGSSYATVSTLAADLGNTVVYAALATGGCLHVISRERLTHGEALGDYFEAHGIDCLKIVPSHLAALLASSRPAACLPRRLLVVGGESTAWDLVDRVRELAPGCRLLNHYGPTETTVGVLTGDIAGSDGARRQPHIPLGRPLHGTRIFILDRCGEVVPQGTPGEVHIGGSNVTRGYAGKPDLTAARFVPDPWGEPGARFYVTGDLARWRPDGAVEFLGRVDHQVKIRGYRVELGEIETVLASHPEVASAVVLAPEAPSGERRLVAYVVSAVSPPDLVSWLRQRLPDAMIPAHFVPLDSLPLTSNGKVDRRVLPSPGNNSPALGSAPPRTLTELHLAQIWEELLGCGPVGAWDNFFDLGGHSLLVVRLMARIRQRFGRDLPLSVLFRSPTLEALAAELRGGVGTDSRQPLVEIQSGNGERPLFLVHPIGGNVLCYLDLARHLGPDLPVYGFQAPDGDGDERLEDLADLYLENLRQVQPQGPYRLGGWSLGGLIAYEMANSLKEDGEEVDLLALIDSHLPGPEPADMPDGALVAEFAGDLANLLSAPLEISPEALVPLGAGDALALLFRWAREARVLPPDLEMGDVRRLFEIFRRNHRASRRFVPRPYPGRLVLFEAMEKGRTNGSSRWDGMAGQGIVVYKVPGDHYSLLTEPRVAALAAGLIGSL